MTDAPRPAKPARARAPWPASLKRIVAAAVVAAAGGIGLIAFHTWNDYTESIARTEDRSRQLAALVEREAGHVFEDAVNELRHAIALRNTTDPGTAARLLAARINAHPLLVALVVPDDAGTLLQAGDPIDAGRLATWAAELPPGGDELTIGKPFAARAGRVKLLPVQIRVPAPDWAPGSAVQAAALLRTDFLAVLVDSLRLGDDTLCVLLDRRGTVIARAPYLENAIGNNVAGAPIYQAAEKGVPAGLVQGVTPADSIHRIMAFKRSPRFPIDATAGFSRERLLAMWRARAWRNASVAAALLLLVGALARLAWKQAKGELAAQHELLVNADHHRTALAVLAEGVVTHDARGAIVTWNDSALRILRLSADQLRGRSPVDPRWRAIREDGSNFPGEEHPAMLALFTGEPQLDSLMGIEIGDGTRHWLMVSAVPSRTDGVIDGAVASFVDITESRLATEKIRSLNSALEERVNARTAALKRTSDELEDLVYSMAHTMRAPLRHIASFATLLAEDGVKRLSADDQDLIRRIRQSADRQARLVDDLLRYTAGHQHQPAFAHVSMEALVDAVIRDTLERMPDARRVEWSRSPLPRLFGDPAMLAEIIEILLSNAAKFSSRSAVPRIEIGACQIEGMAGVEVRDNGVGFDMRYVDKLFGMFQRLHEGEGFKGSGIDLAICRRLVERQGGLIEAEGRVGEGATFRFALPAAHARAQRAAEAAAAGEPEH